MAKSRDVSISIGLDDSGIERDAEAAAKKVRRAVEGGAKPSAAPAPAAASPKPERRPSAPEGMSTRRPSAGAAARPSAQDALVPSLDRLIGGIGPKSGKEGQELKSRLEGFRDAIRKARDEGEGLSDETSRGLAAAFEKWLGVMDKISPGALKRISDDVKKVLRDYQDFSDAVRDSSGVEIRIDGDAVGRLDALRAKLEIIDDVDALVGSVSSLSASLKTIDPSRAEELGKAVGRIRDAMREGIGTESVGRIAALVDELKEAAEPLGTADLRKLAPGLDAVDASFSRLRGSVDAFGETLRGQFDAAGFASSLLSGDVEGLTRGFIGLAAGARLSAAAIKAAFATTVVGAAVAAVSWLVGLVASLVREMAEARRVAAGIRCERLLNDLDAALAANERVRRSLEVQKQISDGIGESLNAQVDATARLEAATLKLGRARAMAAASTRQDREDAEARFAQEASDAEAEAARRRGLNDLAAAKSRVEAAKQTAATREADVEKARGAERGLATEVERLAEKVKRRGGYADYDAETGKYEFYSRRQILSQIAYNNDGMYRWNGFDFKGHDMGVPQAAIDSLKENIRLFNDHGTWGSVSLHWHDDEDYEEGLGGERGAFAKLAEAVDKRIAAENDARLAAEDVRRLVEEEAAKRKSLLAQIDEAAAARQGVAAEIREAGQEAAATGRVSARANRRTLEDALAYDSDRARILSGRIEEEGAFRDAYLEGGVDARGERVKGIRQYEADVGEYERAVEARRLAERAEAGDETLTDEERAAAKDYVRRVSENAGYFAALSAAARQASEQLPKLYRSYQDQQDAIAGLNAQMQRLAREYRDGATEARYAEGERAWGLAERRRSAAYGRKADFAKDAEDRARAEEGARLVKRYDAEAAADARKRELLAAVMSKAEGELDEEERAFKAAYERGASVSEAVVNDLAVRQDRGETTEEEDRLLAEAMEGRVNTSLQSQILARNRGVAEQMLYDSGEAAAARRQERLAANEERKHRYALEDEEYERGRQQRRANSASYRYSVADERNARASARFADADAIAKAVEAGSAEGLSEAQRLVYERETARRDGESDDGYIARMKLFETRLYRARDEARERVVASRDEMDSLRVEAETRRADFSFGAKREANRLTQLGLGGGEAVQWQRRQANDLHEMLGVSKQSLKVMRSFAGNAAAWRASKAVWR